VVLYTRWVSVDWLDIFRSDRAAREREDQQDEQQSDHTCKRVPDTGEKITHFAEPPAELLLTRTGYRR